MYCFSLGNSLQYRLLGSTAHPDRDGMRGETIESDLLQRVVTALEGDERLAPQSSKDLDLLFEPSGACGEVDVQGLVLGGVPADADAQLEAAIAQLLELGSLLGDQRRGIQRQDKNARSEVDALGDRRQVREQDERIVKRPRIGGWRTARQTLGRHGQHVAGGRQQVEARTVEGLGVVANGDRVAHRGDRERSSEFHGRSFVVGPA
jgi:hypothetical protein